MAEEAKPEEVRARTSFDGKMAAQVNNAILSRLLQEFPDLPATPPPPFNLIAEWARRNRFAFDYNEYHFERYNRLFMERLLALRDNSPESADRFRKITLENFGEFDYTQTGFSISFLLRVENNMRELIREIMADLPVDPSRAWHIVFEQSKEYQETVNEVFEKRLQQARDESDRLLHNILPATIALELKRKSRVEPVHLEQVTVLFTDFKGFTLIAEQMAPAELVATLDECFSIFDAIAGEHHLEKIKTIGDSYMCAGGLPEVRATHAIDVALAALKMRDAMARLGKERAARGQPVFELRMGLHSGPVVAGVIGQQKFSYDIWGDTVNTASRMESSGAPGRINVSESSRKLLSPFFSLEARGLIEARNKGKVPMYFLNGLLPEWGHHQAPNAAFWSAYQARSQG
ncbi:MAG: adenylate/guanylate cyclase domain-containing protein [Spirochaetales bacterium]|nr:adenylate/guanylate cyclase domain-containing protein [Spirochaetales bacterium]